MFQTSCRWVGAAALALSAASLLRGDEVFESARELPVLGQADVVVAGGSCGAVEAACHAARQGASVFLVAPEPYLGSDLCATLQLWLDEGEKPQWPLELACFGTGRITTPFTVKREMDGALLAAGIRYLTGCCVTDVLRDGQGQLAGVVVANRSGRQALVAKVIIDATRQAAVARQAGVAFRPFVPGRQSFTRVVVGGEMRTGEGLSGRRMPFTFDSAAKDASDPLPVYQYSLQIAMEDNSVRSFFRAENEARDRTYQPGSESASEVLGYVPSDTIVGLSRAESWPGAEVADFRPFQPAGTDRLYVLSAYADLGREAGAKFVRPLESMALGRRIGQAAARQAKDLPPPEAVSLPATDATGDQTVEVREGLAPLRPAHKATVRCGPCLLPVLGRYDVVVVGGGTSGAPAGIAAARSGAKTLVVEYLHELGGVGTVGLIGNYWYGLRRGFTQQVDEQVNHGKTSWNAVEKAEWFRQELRRSGAEVWLGAFGCGALVRDRQVCGIVVATAQGRGAVLAGSVVDATGNADVAAWAGAETRYGISDTGSLNVQIAGFPERPLGNSYVNTCYTMVDDTDVVDVSHLMAWKRTQSARSSAFDVGQLVDSRERRRIVGDYELSVADILSSRTFPDTISQHYSNFDAAAFPDSPVLRLADAKGPCFACDLPYRCLLPRNLDGLLVVGLGAGAERDAMTLIRMQADLQNQGYAAGMAAAEAARLGGHTRKIDIKALQKKLVRENLLDERVLTDTDSQPASTAQIERAFQVVGAAGQPESLADLALLVAHPEQATPLLRTRCRQVPAGKEQLSSAAILGILGDPTAAPVLAEAIGAHDGWDQGSSLTTQRKTGNTFSDLDRLVIALGSSGSPDAAGPLLVKLGQLQPESRLSHYKALSLAMWNLRPIAAAEPLAGLLDRVKFLGQAEPGPPATVSERLVTVDPDEQANSTSLNRALKELTVAALLYRCGDRDGKAKAVLERYLDNVHGHLARYAQWALDQGSAAAPAVKQE
ncbi:MAG: FAD-dependent oxidoreductase [Thermoguttaceae bacterium]